MAMLFEHYLVLVILVLVLLNQSGLIHNITFNSYFNLKKLKNNFFKISNQVFGKTIGKYQENPESKMENSNIEIFKEDPTSIKTIFYYSESIETQKFILYITKI